MECYGAAELRAAFPECDERTGMHLDPEFYFWEVLDPHTMDPVRWGEPGVLCFSHIGWRARFSCATGPVTSSKAGSPGTSAPNAG